MKGDVFDRELLIDGLHKLDIRPQDHQIKMLLCHLKELSVWNKRINLVKATGDDLIIKHVLDSLAGLHPIEDLEPESVLDAGSGAGFPGIPLAIFLPDIQFTLIDSSTKRAAFMQNVRALIGLANCTIVNERIQEHSAQYELVCCRAFMDINEAFKNLSPRMAAGGSMLFYKGKRNVLEEEIRVLPNCCVARIEEIHVPYLNEERHLLLVR